MQELIAGRIDYQCPNTVAAIPELKSKLVKPIAILSKDRSPLLPNLATAQEQGLKDFEAGNWCAFFFPKGTPDSIVRRLHDATVATMDKASVQERLRELGADVVAPECRSPEYLQSFLEHEIKKWAEFIKQNGVTPN